MKNQSIWKKLKFAFNGIIYATRNEHNMQRHIISTLIVICLFYYLEISILWWALIILCIGLIIAAELLNSAIEDLIDYLHPEIHEKVGKRHVSRNGFSFEHNCFTNWISSYFISSFLIEKM